jgi:uncharacterized protein YfaS (alpha-2-macroglobulin family)
MTLPNRLVSLLLIYCFVVAIAPHSRAAVPEANPVAIASQIPEGNSSAITKVSKFLASLFSSRGNSAADDEVTDGNEGLRFRLSEAPGQPEARPISNVANATPLSDAETRAILRRLPPIKTEPSDEADFALREKSLPPPRTGQTIKQSFPAPGEMTAPDQTTAGSLEVIRYSPEGDVPIAPNLSVTFSQPMVAVSSQEEAAQNVPVRISPQPPGKWRWIGTKTLLFEPDVRFPMATQYSVSVPSGTKSANGGTLAAAKSWTFTTPPPAVKTFYPTKSSVQRRDALMFAEFDQRIDPAAILKATKVMSGATEMRTRLATKEEIDADEQVRDAVKNAEQDRWLVFRAIDANGGTKFALPADAGITVGIGPGAPSAEGPRTTSQTQSFPFLTFGPLRLVKSQCNYNRNAPCTPNDNWLIEFNNPLNAETFDASQIRVEPASDQLKTSIYGNTIYLSGAKQPNTTYHLTIAKSLRDRFDQTLSRDETVEFKVGPAQPWIGLSGQSFVVLDPAGPRQLSFYSVNYQTVKVGLYAVEPADWVQFQIYRQIHYRNDAAAKKARLPGRLILDKQIELKPQNQMTETRIDLTPALKDGLGQVIVVIESIMPASDRNHSPLLAWVQSTQIGLDAFVDNHELVGWATSLADGAPLSDVQVKILPSNIEGTTGSDGVAHLTLKPSSDSSPNLLVARRGNDVAILPENPNNWWATTGTWYHKPQPDELRWYVFDDRKLYRPGEEVHLKGWIRLIGAGKGGDVGPLNGAVKRLSYSVKDEAGNEVGKGEVVFNIFGGFDAAFKLPPTMNLGNAIVEFKTQDPDGPFNEREHRHSFQVQEFRRPEFEVTTKTETESPLFVGGRADVSVAANYFAGGGLQNTEVKWQVTSRPTNFTPPNRDDYTFGKWFPWWMGESDSDGTNTEELTGRTDPGGKHRLRIDFDSVKPSRPSTVSAQASVTDVNRQTWTSTATMLVHPADLYVGLKSERTFVQQGEPLVVQSIVTDLDGKAIANREVKMHAVMLDWQQVKGEWKQLEVNPQDCLIQSGPDPVKCTFAPKQGGTYRVTATIRDDRERTNVSELTLWVAGGKRPPKRGVEQEKVELIPDQKEYKAGDTAQILVQAPFYPAEAVMSLRRSGMVKSERFRMDGPTYTLRVPIEEAWTPNVYVQVDLVGAEDRDAGSADVSSAPSASPKSIRAGALRADGTSALPAKRPAYASGELNLSIPPLTRKLNVVATPRDKTLEPGGNTVINVEAKDATGNAVIESEIAVVVVDESVLALTNYKLADPIAMFYADRSSDTGDYHGRANLLLLSPAQLSGGSGGGGAMETVNVSSDQSVNATRSSLGFALTPSQPSPTMKKGGAKESESKEIRLRENFNALAVFAPSVRTDANGRAQVQVKLPDNLTRYRVMAVAVAGGKQFGSGESAITARLPLMARPSAPRFLNFGDRFELPIVLQNQTDQAMTVEVAVRATNASFLSEPGAVATGSQGAVADPSLTTRSLPLPVLTGRRVTVPPNDRVEIRIPAAAVKAGTARFQIGAVSGRWSDAANVELPVWTPATTEAFATYGEIDNGSINQPVKAPANVFSQFGGLEIETSSTQLQELTDAVIYLTSYPYECSEQLSSRIITIAALRDVLTAFKAKGMPSAEEMEAAVTRDLKRLQGMQNSDGGFGFWQRGNESWPYLSIHVAHALARAKQKKFDVPQEMFEQSRKYLREIESHIPSYYGVDARRAIIAYALYVRAQMSDRDAVGARKLIAEAGLEKLPLESVGWLLSVLSGDSSSVSEVAAIRHLLNNRVTETAGTAHFVCSYSDSDYLVLNSNRRADGVILEALIGDSPNSDLIPKIVRGLLAHRTRGRWENTQENVFILLALDRYFNTFEKITPDFVARAWLGERFAGEQQFKGRSTDRQQVNVPMRYLVDQGGAQNLIISKDGAGRLYYRIGMNYAPSDLNLKPADYGFTVERIYEAVDDPKDVARDTDGTWHIKAGARVRVRLTMVATARRYHVALVDPLPAGFEALNPSLATTGSIPRDDKQTGVGEYGSRSYGYEWYRWRPQWFEHQNLRDERAEAFASLLWEGVYKYSYVARATTPGDFVVPPARAEEMYHPETFGRGKTDRVRVE